MDSKPIIQIHNLTRRFGSLTAVDHLNLEVTPGEIFGLVGPDGAGKTTTLRLLCGLLDPTEGDIRIAGYDVGREIAKVKDHIGYMAQRFALYNDLSVQENMRFYADLFGLSKREQQELMPRLFQMTRMAPFRDRLAGKLSGGMKQKLALMCTLLHRPQLLFLDEPTNGVDPVSRRDFWAILYDLVQEGVTIFVTTAYLDEAERCNRVGLMYRGRLIRCASPDALRQEIEESCYEVQCGDRRMASSFLQQYRDVFSVEPVGSSLHLFLKPSATITAASLQQDLEHAGFGPVSFRQIIPTLEDVFIALIRKAETLR